MTKKGRAKRIILGALLPPIVGLFLLAIWGVVLNYFIDSKDIILRFDHELPILLSILKSAVAYIGAILILALFASFVSGIQSIVISFLMEYIINPKIENNLIVLLIYGLLGVISGVIVDQLIGETSLIVIGGVTGIIVGKILRDNYNRSPEIES